MIDPAAALDGASGSPSRRAARARPRSATIRDRAEVVVVWRADPVTTHPRLLERLRLTATGASSSSSTRGGRRPRSEADTFVELGATRRRGAVDAARARPATRRPRGRRRRRRSTTSPRGCAAARGARSCITSRATSRRWRCTRSCATCAATRHAVDADAPRTRATPPAPRTCSPGRPGYPAAVSFARGHPRANPGELSAAAVLERGDVDAALVVGSDPLEHLPAAAADAPARDPGRVGRRPEHGDRRRRARRVHHRRAAACTAPASCTARRRAGPAARAAGRARARATRTCSRARSRGGC